MREELKKVILQIETIEELRETYELLNRMQTHLKSVAAVQFHVGDKVYFMSSKKNSKIEGIVRKVNSTTIKVDAGTHGSWRVSPTMLVKIS